MIWTKVGDQTWATKVPNGMLVKVVEDGGYSERGVAMTFVPGDSGAEIDGWINQNAEVKQ